MQPAVPTETHVGICSKISSSSKLLSFRERLGEGNQVAEVIFEQILRNACGQPQCKMAERDEIERVVMQDRFHRNRVAAADKIGVGRGYLAAGNVAGAMTPAEKPFERLQFAVGQIGPPAATGVMQQVAMYGLRAIICET